MTDEWEQVNKTQQSRLEKSNDTNQTFKVILLNKVPGLHALLL